MRFGGAPRCGSGGRGILIAGRWGEEGSSLRVGGGRVGDPYCGSVGVFIADRGKGILVADRWGEDGVLIAGRGWGILGHGI